MRNTNYNMAVAGTSGAGKTGLIQPMLRSVLDTGGAAWVFDMGDGYKSLCENMGGVYIDAQTLKFNPFANVKDINLSATQIANLISVMASPDGSLDEVHESLLEMAVKAAWLSKQRTPVLMMCVTFCATRWMRMSIAIRRPSATACMK